VASDEDVQEAIGWMSKLNRDAGKLASEFDLRGGTDVTGFSLLGHGMEMAEASGVKFNIRFGDVPFISCARKYAEQWTFPGGSSDNRLHFGAKVTFNETLTEMEQLLLFDAQTSGGLLLCISKDKLSAFKSRAEELDQPAWVIGEVVEGDGIEVV
jgi:selenide,water dikinase